MTLSPLEMLALPGLASSATKGVGHALSVLIPGGSPFAQKLADAQAPDAQLPVDIGKGVELELTDEQLKRLADAVDRAEAEGSTTAAVMIDGMALEVDVTMRTVRGVIDQDQGISTQIDAVVYAEQASESAAAPLPNGLAEHPDIRRILSESGTDQSAA